MKKTIATRSLLCLFLIVFGVVCSVGISAGQPLLPTTDSLAAPAVAPDQDATPRGSGQIIPQLPPSGPLSFPGLLPAITILSTPIFPRGESIRIFSLVIHAAPFLPRPPPFGHLPRG